MKKFLGLFCAILTFVLVCAFVTGCNDSNTTDNPSIPGIGTSDSGTTGTTDTTDTTATTGTTGTNGTTGTTGTTGTNGTTGTTGTTASTVAPENLVIFLDPGHGGSDPGAVKDYDFDGTGTDFTMTTYKEADINLAVALKAKEKLEKLGYKVVLSRTDDTYVDVNNRAQLALDAKASMFISIHVNSHTGDVAHGFESYYSGKTGLGYDAKAFAALFTKEFEEIKNVKNDSGAVAYPDMSIRGTKADTELYTNGLAVLNQKESYMPSTLLELGFLSNEKDAFMLRSTYWQNYAAEAIADAVVAAHIAGIYKK